MALEAELLQQLADKTDAMMYLKDEEGRYLWVNRRVAEALKKTPEELIGKKDTDFLAKDQAERFREYDRKVAQTGTPLNYKDTVTLPAGRYTIVDHKFPVSVAGHEHAVGGIAIEMK